MDRAKTLEKFAADHPEVTVLRLCLADKKGVPYKDSNEWADAYGIMATPTLIIESEDGRELVRLESAVSVKDLDKALQRAQERLKRGPLALDTLKPEEAR
jgi:protein-disulfide isomerase